MGTPDMNISSPIFLVGAERSGTTLLRLMLDHHPQIAFNYEFEFAVDQIDAAGNWPDLSAYYEYLAYHRIFLSTGFAIDPSLDYPALVNDFLLQKQQRDNKPIVGATVHHKFHNLIKIWPKAKFIHILRDGRDVARSNIFMGWAGNMFTSADLWIVAERLWIKLRTQLQPEQQITIYYEELIQTPEQILTQICDFIGVPFDQAMFDYAKHSTYSSPDPSIKERWRKQLTDYEIQLAECKIATMLTERGYPLSGLPLLKITPWLRLRMYIQNRWYKNLFRIRRYSFSLYLQDFLSRRLGMKNWQKRVKLRINATENKYIK
jgi:hypothetical protein